MSGTFYGPRLIPENRLELPDSDWRPVVEEDFWDLAHPRGRPLSWAGLVRGTLRRSGQTPEPSGFLVPTFPIGGYTSSDRYFSTLASRRAAGTGREDPQNVV